MYIILRTQDKIIPIYDSTTDVLLGPFDRVFISSYITVMENGEKKVISYVDSDNKGWTRLLPAVFKTTGLPEGKNWFCGVEIVGNNPLGGTM